MKKILIFTLVALFFAAKGTAQVVNIPDVAFKSYLVGNKDINTNGDSEIQQSEAVTYKGAISANSKGIKSLTGIEVFVNLKILYCFNNSLTALDVSKNVALTDLWCNKNSITALDVSKNVALTKLDCSECELTALDVSKNVALTNLNCSRNYWLTTLDVSKSVALIELNCSSAKIKALDVSKSVALTVLACPNNSINNLDVSKNTALTDLFCFFNPLSDLDVSKNVALTKLLCYENRLTALDVSQNVALIFLYCNENSLTSLDVSKNVALSYLLCHKNSLTSLDVSKNVVLGNLWCSNNALTALDVSKNIYLSELLCYKNSLLVSLNLKNGNNKKLITLDAADNPSLKCIQVDNIYNISTKWEKSGRATYKEICTVSAAVYASLKLYPNPAGQSISVRWYSEIEFATLDMYNAQGQLILTQGIANEAIIDVETLPRGLYFCQFKHENNVFHREKVILE